MKVFWITPKIPGKLLLDEFEPGKMLPKAAKSRLCRLLKMVQQEVTPIQQE